MTRGPDEQPFFSAQNFIASSADSTTPPSPKFLNLLFLVSPPPIGIKGSSVPCMTTTDILLILDNPPALAQREED